MGYIKSRRTKPRPGRLDAAGMEVLRRQVFERDHYRCAHRIGMVFANKRCGVPITWETGHLAHIKSRGAGGHDTAENTYCCCAECHTRFHQVGPSMTKICLPKQ